MLYIHILLIFLLFILSTFRIYKNAKIKYIGNPLTIIIIIYLISAISSTLIRQDIFPTFNFYNHEFYHYLLYTFFIIFSLSPIILMRGYRMPEINIKKTKKIKFLLLILGFFALYAFFYQLPYAIKALNVGAIDIRVGTNGEKTTILPENILTTIAVAISSFYVFFIFLFFISLKQKMNNWITLTMFIGGLCYVISSICFAARDGSLFYLFTNIFAYQLFKEQLSEKTKKHVVRILFITGLIASLFLLFFTFQRFFDTNSTHSGLNGTISYIGQQPFVFVENLIQRQEYYGWDLRFPIIKVLLGGNVEPIYRSMPYEWSFGTFLTDYYSAFGWLSLFSLSILNFIIPSIIFYKKKSIHPLVFYFIIAFYFQFMSSGVFYLRLGTWAGNIYMSIIFFTILILSIFYKSKKNQNG